MTPNLTISLSFDGASLSLNLRSGTSINIPISTKRCRNCGSETHCKELEALYQIVLMDDLAQKQQSKIAHPSTPVQDFVDKHMIQAKQLRPRSRKIRRHLSLDDLME